MLNFKLTYLISADKLAPQKMLRNVTVWCIVLKETFETRKDTNNIL